MRTPEILGVRIVLLQFKTSSRPTELYNHSNRNAKGRIYPVEA